MSDQDRYASATEWEAAGAEKFGPDMTKWAFECPSCGNVMSVEKARADFPELKGCGWAAGQECLGRYSPKILRPDGTRCDWAAYGLFRGPVFVKRADGSDTAAFRFAPAPKAPPGVPHE